MKTELASGVLLASSASTVARTSDPVDALGGVGGLFFLSVTADPANEETITFSIQAHDPVSGWVAYLAASAVSDENTPAVYTFVVGSGAGTSPTLGASIQLPLPPRFRVVVTPSGSGSWTYSLAWQELP